MQFFKHIRLFFHIHWQQLKRKWIILPLLLLFPLFIVSMTIFIVASFFDMDENLSISVGVVDLDQSTETTMIVDLLEETSQLGTLNIHSLSETDAIDRIENNEMSSYIVLPENFAADLYKGKSVNLAVRGNPKQEIESHIIHELISSVMRHIQTAQANILLINEYAKRTTMDTEARSELVMNEFMRSLMSVLGREQIVSEQRVENLATDSPVKYFLLSTFFIVITLWSLVIFYFFYREEDTRMQNRLRVYGVTSMGQAVSRMLATLAISFSLGVLALFILYRLANFEMFFDDMIHILQILLLYSVGYIMTLILIETIVSDSRIRMLLHSILTLVIIILSGAIIPVLYFPLYIQDILTFIPSYQALFWWQEILLNEGLYVEYWPLMIYAMMSFLLFVAIATIKERVRE